MGYLRFVTALVLVCAFCTGCHSKNETPSTATIFAMDTYMTLTVYGEHASEALTQGEDCIQELDAMLSTGTATSEIAQLNATGSGVLSADAANILAYALEISADTGGAFQPLLYPLMEAWGFPTQNYRVPEPAELESLLALTDLEQLVFDPDSGSVTLLEDGMAIDLGGIAKGYTGAKLMEIFQSCGVESAMVSLGGNVQVLGTKPDGSSWRIALENPKKDGTYLGVLEVADVAVVTSGGYERYFEQDGVTYHHILDPSTGAPADSGLQSVTIISEDGTLADGLSTALFVMGLEEAEAYWKVHSDDFEAVLLTDENILYVTAGIVDQFSDAAYEVVVIAPA